MCTGVTNGFYGVNLAGSLWIYSCFRVIIVSIMLVIANDKMSFTVEKGVELLHGLLRIFQGSTRIAP